MSLGKAHVVADALSRSSMDGIAHMEKEKKELAKKVTRLALLGAHLCDTDDGGLMV